MYCIWRYSNWLARYLNDFRTYRILIHSLCIKLFLDLRDVEVIYTTITYHMWYVGRQCNNITATNKLNWWQTKLTSRNRWERFLGSLLSLWQDDGCLFCPNIKQPNLSPVLFGEHFCETNYCPKVLECEASFQWWDFKLTDPINIVEVIPVHCKLNWRGLILLILNEKCEVWGILNYKVSESICQIHKSRNYKGLKLWKDMSKEGKKMTN